VGAVGAQEGILYYLHGAEIFPESMVDDDTHPRGPKGVLWSFHM